MLKDLLPPPSEDRSLTGAATALDANRPSWGEAIIVAVTLGLSIIAS
jgi:hypothetical protein